ncbi:MAG: 23S rRNA (guanosine(2251)-2'-O)-methyltransferase RlmB [Pseudomonadota bacterium]
MNALCVIATEVAVGGDDDRYAEGIGVSDAVGFQAARAVLADTPQRARCLFVQRGRRDARVSELIALAKDNGVRFRSVDPGWFHKRGGDLNHQGIWLQCSELELLDEGALFAAWEQLPDNPLFLILDGVTDPRNLGACLRTADGAGVAAVLLPKRRSAPISELVLRVAQGGAENLRLVEVTNLARAMRGLAERGVWIVGAADTAEQTYTQFEVAGPTALVMGSEDTGLRRLTQEHCDALVAIPMAGRVSSLNVSVATGVVLYEWQRQRGLDDC